MGISAFFGSLLEGVAGSIFGTGGLLGTVGTAVGAGALEGAAIGAGTSAITGGNIGKGALLGGLTGGIGGGATSGLEAIGVGSGVSGVLGPALGGAGAAGITGGNIGQGALSGFESGLISSALNGINPKGGIKTGGSVSGGASNAAGTAAPASIGGVDPNALASGGSGQFSGAYSGLPGDVTTGTGGLGTGGGGAGLPGDIGQGAAGGGGSGLTTSGGTGNFAGSFSGGSDALITGGGTGPFSGAYSGTTSSVGPASGSATGAKSVTGGLHIDPMTALVGAGLVGNVLQGNKKPEGYDALSALAKTNLQGGQQLESYLNSGTLPPGLQASLTSATNAAEATIRSQYAARGMSGSSAEAQDIAKAKSSAFEQGAGIAMQLYQQGVSETDIGAQIYSQLMKVSQEQDAASGAAIGNFAAAMAGLGRTNALAATVGG